ncbi:adenylosuccinate lyase [Pediococcus argentinicus]|uniref:Adenylosuccinate lyase n=1 Tax=Pediococcus argentinicus TaxID=480391 RepID=A0A0R2NGY7_9LACO|nr:adenylosuccinate lyase [Pediococcus argentinicus]KRO22947.1 adenylosuccinate lyase [Pediococcus argentinicus]NKZ22958.1 adenylosuccinate lyase [Pediococcus argentinicus]GEP20049.1 adenylosuccinate lyase [Pediococcus argentinicus]
MLERYMRKEMEDIWSRQRQFETWLDTEKAVVEAWNFVGEIPTDDYQKIEENASFDIDRIDELEQITHHDVIAFTRTVSESLGDEKKWVHYGLTSTDVVDTAQSIRIKQANDIIEKDLIDFSNELKTLAIKYKKLVVVGRTHGIHAEPTTLGLKFLRWYSETQRNINRFKQVRKEIEVGKISGAVGTFANVPPEVEERVCERLGLGVQDISTQVLPRDLHANYMSELALIGSEIEEIATEIRALQRTEINELREGFAKGQKGSSAMPHKRNPISSENVSGLARVLRGEMVTSFENINLWHERDISHSSAERIILPDATALVDYILNRMTNVLRGLVVNEDAIKRNLEQTHGLIFSQHILLSLIEAGWSREDAYDTIQPITMRVWETGVSFKDLLLKNNRIVGSIGKEHLTQLFDLNFHLRNVDKIFARFDM